MAANHTIVVLDDDDAFRESMIAILKPRGFTVLEAKSAQEASSILASVEPLLVIVDYRLPGGTDGVSWITQLREQGRQFPIVFISADWCDAKTFNWLRNILKVSLILNKPIVPNLFIQQIEPLLPRQIVQSLSDQADERSMAANDEAMILLDQLIGDKNNISKQTLADLEHVANNATNDEELLAQLRQFKMKMNVEKQLRSARAGYLKQLLSEWQNLARLVQAAQQEPNNRLALDEGLQASHRIAGSAGTFGFTAVGETSKRIEGYLRAFDPEDTLQEVLWNETFRALGDGERLVHTALEDFVEGDMDSTPSSQVLLIGAESKFASHIEYVRDKNDVNIIVSDNPAGALNKVKKTKFDSLIVDLTFDKPYRLLQLIEEIRSVEVNQLIPVGIICDAKSRPSAMDILYYGVSQVIGQTLSSENLSHTIGALQTIGQSRKPRVLVVDDDDKLSGFVATILSGEDMVVDTLAAPIRIMEMLQEFQPDLVILDVMMPGLSGYDVCRMIRHSDQFSSLPIIFLTSKSTAEGRAAAFQAGGNDFLSKPVMAAELLARVHGQVDKLNLHVDAGADAAGLLSRKRFFTGLAEKIEIAKTTEQELSICLITIDDFLSLGILHSMMSAEQTLLGLGHILQSHFRAEDLRGRLGEEAFAIACLGVSKDTLLYVVDKILKQFEDLRFSSVAYGHFKSSFSAGLANFPRDGDNVADLLNSANQKMLNGRQKGLGKVVV
jgi:diguanylate cyclase (GGDEF)-like protein